jgi:hypothetical protein
MSANDKRMSHFALLTADEQRAAIARLANSGMSESTIAAATMLSIEMIRKILGKSPL